MSRVWTLGGGLATAASLGLAAVALRPSPTPAAIAPGLAASATAALPEAARFAPRGAGSCSASACHGGHAPLPPAISGVLRNEHTTWITRDPHASAYEVLGDPRSERIERNLAKGGAPIAAAEDARCLACHATPTAHPESLGPDLADAIRRDGVGCESCHGDSSGWLAEHTQAGWAGRSTADKARAYNFTDLRDLNARARTCAGCHVGAPADPSRGLPLRDVNHDLIAAGHPRLNWEFSAYVANYPKHWVQKGKTADWDARLWKVGQLATLHASAELLEDRARRADAGAAPWPELAEYNCFSCHFTLKESPFRGRRDPEQALGTPAWASWNRAMLPVLAQRDGGAGSFGVEENVAGLGKAMGAMTTDPKAVAAQAADLRASLDRWIGGGGASPLDRATLERLVRDLNARDEKGRRALVNGWDSAAQLYLALAAAHASLGAQGGADPALRSDLDALLKDLSFEKGFDSPRGFDPSRPK